MKKIFKKIVVAIITLEARAVLWLRRPRVVAVTGSVGKTSTKDAIYTAMSGFYRVRKSVKSFNSEIGIPLTVLGLNNEWTSFFGWAKNIILGALKIISPFSYPEWLILEVGADKPGDIDNVANWLKTDVVVMTRIAEIPVHVENFENRAAIVKEKSHLIRTLKSNGTLILNFDDPTIISLKQKTDKRVVTFGFDEGAELRASNYHLVCEGDSGSLIPQGINFKVDYNGNILPVRLNGIFGRQNVYTALAALAVGLSQKINLVEVIDTLREHVGPSGRFKPLKGKNNTLIIDDTYNSSPVALEMALQSFGEIKNSGRKIAALGDMLELGKHTEEAHTKIGGMLPGICDLLVVVGERARFFAEGAKKAGMDERKIHYFQKSSDAANFLRDNLRSGDAILVKGSQGVRMEKVVEQLVAENVTKEDMVRQEKEWSKR